MNNHTTVRSLTNNTYYDTDDLRETVNAVCTHLTVLRGNDSSKQHSYWQNVAPEIDVHVRLYSGSDGIKVDRLYVHGKYRTTTGLIVKLARKNAMFDNALERLASLDSGEYLPQRAHAYLILAIAKGLSGYSFEQLVKNEYGEVLTDSASQRFVEDVRKKCCEIRMHPRRDKLAAATSDHALATIAAGKKERNLDHALDDVRQAEEQLKLAREKEHHRRDMLMKAKAKLETATQKCISLGAALSDTTNNQTT
jgi:hypothetical protein